MSAYSSGSIIKILVKRIEFQLDGTWKVRQELSVKVKPKTVDTAHEILCYVFDQEQELCKSKLFTLTDQVLSVELPDNLLVAGETYYVTFTPKTNSQDYTGSYKQPGNRAGNPEFTKYQQIGLNFKENPTEEHKNMYQMIDEAVKICHDGVMPFIVVCSSSGTGKTQLPFSLDYPLLYFTAVETSQSIYANFKFQSASLKKAVDFDLKAFSQACLAKKQQKAALNLVDEALSELDFSMRNINATSMADHCFKTCGYLVEMLRICKQTCQESNDKYANWIAAEMACPHFEYPAMTINDALVEISRMFERIRPPLIFLDEIARMVQDNEKLKYRFFCSIVRSCRIIFIGMGINADANDFVGLDKGYQGSRCVERPHCFIVHKLPPICPG